MGDLNQGLGCKNFIEMRDSKSTQKLFKKTGVDISDLKSLKLFVS
jgi:hypothetical protein